MEEEKAEAASNDTCQSIQFVITVAALVCFTSYWYIPAMVREVFVVMAWFDWFFVFLRNLFFVFLVVSVITLGIYISFGESETTVKKKLDVYLGAYPPPPRESTFGYCNIPGGQDVGYYNNSSYRETAPAVQEVKAVEESSFSYDREVVEVSSNSYGSTKKYRRTESERVTKAASWRSQSSEESRTTVETFITEKKKSLHQVMYQNGGVPQWQQNGVVDHLQNGVFPQLQNGVVPQWRSKWHPEPQNAVVQWQGTHDGVVPQWQQNSVVPQWQNGLPEPQNALVQWQGSRDSVVPQWQQNGVVSQWQSKWQNGLPEPQNALVQWQGSGDDVVPQWQQNGVVPHWQNGVVAEPQKGIVQWQGPRDDGSGRHRRRHGHRSRSQS